MNCIFLSCAQDLTDVEGDVKYDITTFASKYGVRGVARFASSLLSIAYCAAVALPFVLKNSFRVYPMVFGHLALLVHFLWNYRKLEPSNMDSVKEFYKAIWTNFYLEYFLYPFI